VIQGSDDPVVNPVSGTEIFSRLGSSDKQLVQIAAEHHGILRGDASEDVKEKVLVFLKSVLG
jgi:esterase/lipase